jgi:hypothetical protein
MIKRWLLAVAMLCAVTYAQVPVTSIVQPRVTFVDAAGEPCVGCKLYSYVAGTTTPFPTYTDSTGNSQNTNPVILDASGGAFIWVGRSSYKFILKTALDVTIWSVDNVNEGNLFPCGPAGSVQFANVAVTGLDCDSNIFINKTNHTFNVGNIGTNRVVIGALGSPTLWTFDTTTPATALASLGGAAANPGTTNQLAYYAASGNVVSGTNAIPNGITATTQAADDNSAKVATTAYVKTPGAIHPTGIAIASGGNMTDNQGTGAKVQHSTGTAASGNLVMFDGSGNTVDSGTPAGGGVTTRTCNANGCYRIEGDGTIEQWGVSTAFPTGGDTAAITVAFPVNFTTTTNLSFTAFADNCADGACTTKTPVAITGSGGGPSTASIVVYASGVVPTGGGGTVLNNAIHVYWHAIGY